MSPSWTLGGGLGFGTVGRAAIAGLGMAGTLDYKAVTTPQLRFRASLLDADVEIAGPRAREPEEVVWRPLAA